MGYSGTARAAKTLKSKTMPCNVPEPPRRMVVTGSLLRAINRGFHRGLNMPKYKTQGNKVTRQGNKVTNRTQDKTQGQGYLWSSVCTTMFIMPKTPEKPYRNNKLKPSRPQPRGLTKAKPKTNLKAMAGPGKQGLYNIYILV